MFLRHRDDRRSCLLIGLQRGEEMILNPVGGEAGPLKAGDQLILLSRVFLDRRRRPCRPSRPITPADVKETWLTAGAPARANRASPLPGPSRAPLGAGHRGGRVDARRPARRLRAGRRRPRPDLPAAQERAGPRPAAGPAARSGATGSAWACRSWPRATSPRSTRRTWSSTASSTSPRPTGCRCGCTTWPSPPPRTSMPACSGVAPWGAALAALAFTFCGFQAIHSSHEPFYLPGRTCRCAPASPSGSWRPGGSAWLVALALASGVHLTLGHFQIQTWTGGLVVLTGPLAGRGRSPALAAWPWLVARGRLGSRDRRRPARLELGVRPAGRARPAASSATCSFYSYPPSHWFELALPRLFRELRGGPEDPYWFGQQTTGFEACLYVGTIPLILAFVGAARPGRNRAMMPWRLLVPSASRWPRCRGGGRGLSLPARGAGPGIFPRPGAVHPADQPGPGHPRAGRGSTAPIAVHVPDREGCSAVAFGRRGGRLAARLVAAERLRSLRDVAGLPFGFRDRPPWPGRSAWRRCWPGDGKSGLLGPVGADGRRAGPALLRGDHPMGMGARAARASPVLDELASDQRRQASGGRRSTTCRSGRAWPPRDPYLGFTPGSAAPAPRAVQERTGPGPADPASLLAGCAGSASRTASGIGRSAGCGRGAARACDRPGARSASSTDRRRPARADLERRPRRRRIPRGGAAPATRVASTAPSDRTTLAAGRPRTTPGYLAGGLGAGGRPARAPASACPPGGRSGTVEHDGPCDLDPDPVLRPTAGGGESTTRPEQARLAR